MTTSCLVELVEASYGRALASLSKAKQLSIAGPGS